MKIEIIVNAAIGATLDRRDVTALSKNLGTLSPRKQSSYEILSQKSGPSVHNPIKIVKNWIRAYHANIERQKMIEQLNAPFKDKTATKIIAAKIARKFGNK